MALEYNTVNAVTRRAADLKTGGPRYSLSLREIADTKRRVSAPPAGDR